MPRVLLVLLALGALLATSCGLVSEAAALVEGEKITQASVEDELGNTLDSPEAREFIRQRGLEIVGPERRAVLSGLILLTLQRQEARERGIEVTEQEIAERVRSLEEQSGPGALEDFLAQQNLNREQFTELVGRQMLLERLREAVTEEIEVPRAAIEQAYEQNRTLFTEVHLRQIVVETEEAANDVLRSLQEEGADFEELAAARSVTDQVDLGFIELRSGQLPEAEQAQIEGAAEGGLVGPIQTGGGAFAVLQVVERRVTPLEEVRDQIAEGLLGSRRATGFAQWMEDRIKGADIVVNPKYGRLDPEAVDTVSEQLSGPGGSSPIIIASASDLGP